MKLTFEHPIECQLGRVESHDRSDFGLLISLPFSFLALHSRDIEYSRSPSTSQSSKRVEPTPREPTANLSVIELNDPADVLSKRRKALESVA